MNLQVKDISSVVKSLTVEVPLETVSDALGVATTQLQKSVKLPGFRPGRVPLSLLHKKYMPALQEEVLQALIPEYYQKAIVQAGLSPVEHPVFESIAFRPGAPLSFTARVEVAPSLPPLQYAGLTLPRAEIQVTPAQVDAALVRLRDEQGSLEVCPEDHVIEMSDYAVLDVTVEIDGKGVAPWDGLTLRVGAQDFLPDSVESALVGRKKGDHFVETVSFSAERADPKIAGKSGRFDVTVQEVKQKHLPGLDDEFAKDMGFSSLSELQEKLTESLTQKEKMDVEAQQKSTLVGLLLSTYPFDVPPALVRREAELLASRLRNSGADRGQDEALYAQCEPVAADRVKRFFLLSAIADIEGIEVQDDDVALEIQMLASRNQTSPDEIQARSDYPRFLEEMKVKIRAGKTVDRIYALAQFSEVPAAPAEVAPPAVPVALAEVDS